MARNESDWAAAQTAPGWEELSVVLLPPLPRSEAGAGGGTRLRPGFRRLALITEVIEAGEDVQLVLQHSAEGGSWEDLVVLPVEDQPGSRILWIEAADGVEADLRNFQPARVQPYLRIRWAGAGEHRVLVEAVALYSAETLTPPAAAAERGSGALPAAAGGRTR